MFGYTLIKKEELERLEKLAGIGQRLISYSYWFSGFGNFYKVLEKFAKGEVHSASVWELRRELASSLGTDDYGHPLITPKNIIPMGVVADKMIFTSTIKPYPDQPNVTVSFDGSMQRIGDKMRIKRPVGGSRPQGYDYEGDGEVIEVMSNHMGGQDFIVEMVKVKGWQADVPVMVEKNVSHTDVINNIDKALMAFVEKNTAVDISDYKVLIPKRHYSNVRPGTGKITHYVTRLAPWGINIDPHDKDTYEVIKMEFKTDVKDFKVFKRAKALGDKMKKNKKGPPKRKAKR